MNCYICPHEFLLFCALYNDVLSNFPDTHRKETHCLFNLNHRTQRRDRHADESSGESCIAVGFRNHRPHGPATWTGEADTCVPRAVSKFCRYLPVAALKGSSNYIDLLSARRLRSSQAWDAEGGAAEADQRTGAGAAAGQLFLRRKCEHNVLPKFDIDGVRLWLTTLIHDAVNMHFALDTKRNIYLRPESP